MSGSHSQEFGLCAVLASDWLFTQCAANQESVSSLKQLLTIAKTHKFPPPELEDLCR